MEGKYKISGELASDEEEKKELVAPCAVEWPPRGKGADAVQQTSINSDYVDKTSSIADNHTRSNMIISGGRNSSKFNIYVATCTANLAAVAAGCILTWTSPTLSKITKPGEKIQVTDEEAAWISSFVAVGACFGPFVAGFVVDKIGRKWTLLADMIAFLISWSMLAFSSSVCFLYLARILAGLGIGCIFTVLPMYVAEIAPVELRGMLGSLLQFFLCVGFLISYGIGPYSSYLTLILASAAVPVLCVLTFVWIPESPYYLLSQDRKQEAISSLQWLRGYPDASLMQAEINEMQAAAEETKKQKGSIKILFSNKGNMKALYYACTILFFQQTSGINVVLFYAESIFEATGSSLSSSVSTIIIGVVMLSAAGVAAPAARICGVKNLLCLSAIGESISLGALGYYFYLKDGGTDVSQYGWIPITSMVFFIITYCIGFGPFPWVIMAEIFPANLKAIASACTASFCWFLCFVLTRYFSTFTNAFGRSVAFWLFGVMCVVSLFFVLFQLPNTEGKSFQEIQELIHGKKKSDNEQKV